MDIVEALAARFAVLLAKIEELNLSNATVAAGIFGFLAAVCGVRVTYRWYRLSHVPGPALAGWSKYWIVRESMRGRQPIAIKEVTDKYGTCFPPSFGSHHWKQVGGWCVDG